MRRKKKPSTKPRRRYQLPGPDKRNVPRGVEWLSKIREGIEAGRKPDDIIEEMSMKRDDENLWNRKD